MPEPQLPPAFRSLFDQGLTEVVDQMLSAAADYDGVDEVEANLCLAHDVSTLLEPNSMAVIVAALAIRLHRLSVNGLTTADRYGRCVKCGSVLRWWPPEGQWPGRWQHLDLDAWGAVESHRADVAA